MSFKIDYTDTADDPETKRAAINDLIRYVGKTKAQVLLNYARHLTTDEDFFLMLVGIAGVSGYPAHCLWDYATHYPTYIEIRGGHRGIHHPTQHYGQ